MTRNSYLETNFQIRQQNNEKARKEMMETKEYQDFANLCLNLLGTRQY